jgi:hypothetical protein
MIPMTFPSVQSSMWVTNGPLLSFHWHYGHLAHDSREHAVSLLDALALERAVDAGWTSARRPAKPHHDMVSRRHRSSLASGGGRSVDVKAPSRRYQS